MYTLSFWLLRSLPLRVAPVCQLCWHCGCPAVSDFWKFHSAGSPAKSVSMLMIGPSLPDLGAVWIHKSKRGSCFPIRLVYVNLETKLKSLLEAVTTNAFLTPTVILPGFKMKSNFWDFPQFRSPAPILPLKQSESKPLSLGRRCLAAQVCNGDVLF